MGYLCANFSLPGPLCSRRTRRCTRHVRQHHRLMPPPYGGGGITMRIRFGRSDPEVVIILGPAVRLRRVRVSRKTQSSSISSPNSPSPRSHRHRGSSSPCSHCRWFRRFSRSQECLREKPRVGRVLQLLLLLLHERLQVRTQTTGERRNEASLIVDCRQLQCWRATRPICIFVM